MTEFYIRSDGVPPGNRYSHAVAFTGRTVIISGQLPLDRDGRLAGTDPATQMRQVFQHLGVALAAGTSMAQVAGLVHPEARVEIEALAVAPLA